MGSNGILSSTCPVDTLIIARLSNGLKNRLVSVGSVFCVRSLRHPYYNTGSKAIEFFLSPRPGSVCVAVFLPGAHIITQYREIWIFWRSPGEKTTVKAFVFRFFYG